MKLMGSGHSGAEAAADAPELPAADGLTVIAAVEPPAVSPSRVMDFVPTDAEKAAAPASVPLPPFASAAAKDAMAAPAPPSLGAARRGLLVSGATAAAAVAPSATTQEMLIFLFEAAAPREPVG